MARKDLENQLSSFLKIQIKENRAYFTPGKFLTFLWESGGYQQLPSSKKIAKSLYSCWLNGRIFIVPWLVEGENSTRRPSFICLIIYHPEQFSQLRKLSPPLLRIIKRRVHRTLRRLLRNISKSMEEKLKERHNK